MEPQYEEQFTALIDFLGFSDAAADTDETRRLKILELLLSLSALRSDFAVQTIADEGGKRSTIKPAVSAFSDHILISYPLQPIMADTGYSENFVAFFVLSQFMQLLSAIAGAALRLGFLVRGGATIGKLYHARGVVFGEAMVEAFELEARIANYPRVALSTKITGRPIWMQNQITVLKDQDGINHIDYFQHLPFQSAQPPGDGFTGRLEKWFEEVVPIVTQNLSKLESAGKLHELAKWTWFARHFRNGLERLNPEILKALNISIEAIPWGK